MYRSKTAQALLLAVLATAVLAADVRAGEEELGLPAAGELADSNKLAGQIVVPAAPAPPPLNLMPDDSDETPAAPTPAGADEPVSTEEAVEDLPEPVPPAPDMVCPPVCVPDCAPCAIPVPCCTLRNRLTLEGTFSALNSPEGPFGLQAFTGSQMNWDGLDYGGELGARLTYERMLSDCSWLEVRGEYLGGWSDSSRSTGNFAFVPPIPGIAAFNTATMSSEADVFMGEVNYWATRAAKGRSGWEYGGGLRVISFNEEARADNFAVPFAPGFPTAPFVNSKADNLFIGAQVAGAYRAQLACRLEMTFGAKLLLGSMQRDLTVTDSSMFSGGAHSAAKSSESELTMGVEASIDFRWTFSRRLALTGGYRVLVLEDVVRANDAMDFTKSFSGAVQAQQATDELYLHSLFLGLSLDF